MVKMEKKKNNKLLIAALALIAVVFVITAVISARSAYNKRIAEEKLTEVDFYSMQQFCGKNASAVMDAIASGKKEKLEKQLPGAEGIDDVMGFADWSKADFKGAVSMGAGSLSASPDENGMMDISEKFIVQAGDDKYVLFIETLTSRWGRENEGVSAVATLDEIGISEIRLRDTMLRAVNATELFANARKKNLQNAALKRSWKRTLSGSCHPHCTHRRRN